MIQRMVITLVLCPLLIAQPSTRAEREFDPLTVLAASFPKSVRYKNHGKLLEFCPDNTCHGFSTSSRVSKTTLKDFAFLYVYYYSDYFALPKWRAKKEAMDTASLVLSKSSYRGCRKSSNKESARCILSSLSGNDRIKLLFIRYDEGKRNVVEEDVADQLSKGARSQQ